MLITNNSEHDLIIINGKNEPVFTLDEGEQISIPVDTRTMIDWKIEYDDERIIHFFDLFDDSLSLVEISLKEKPDYTYDEEHYIPMGKSMPHTIQ